MQLHNRLSNLFQKETTRLLKSFLDDNPDLLKKYVNGSVATVGAILKPVNVFMRHLLTLQGLDPDAVPGEKQRLLLQEALTTVFTSTHEDDFESDYNLDWVQKKFEETRGKLAQLELSKEKFMDLTDLSRLPMDELPAINRVAPEVPKKEIPLDTPEGRQSYREKVLNEAKIFLKEEEKTIFDPGNPIDALREAVKAIEKEVIVKKGVKTKKKKLNKSPDSKRNKVTRVHRTTDILPVETEIDLECKAGIRPSTKRQPGRSLNEIARNRKNQAKIAKESTPEFQAQIKARLIRATELTNLMLEKGLVEPNEQARQDQINSMINWSDNNFDALERVITKYAPTKDAVAENKFKGSFRRVMK